MQEAAVAAITREPAQRPGHAAASLVAIDNKTGQVRAMVGGQLVNGDEDYTKYPFNLATEGFRQPGSAFKPFTLAVALEHGYGPSSVFDSKPLDLIVPNSGGKEHYMVKNFGNEYSGPISLASATDRLGQQRLHPARALPRRRHQADRADGQGDGDPLAGLDQPRDDHRRAQAGRDHAGHGARLRDDRHRRSAGLHPGLGAPHEGPVGIAQIQCLVIKCHGKQELYATPQLQARAPARRRPRSSTRCCRAWCSTAPAPSAAISGVDVAGKTGTTSNYGDAWFVGWTPQITTAVWVGYPNKLIPMTTLYNGQPVEGGTFPADIWHNFMVQALQIQAEEAVECGKHRKTNGSLDGHRDRQHR